MTNEQPSLTVQERNRLTDVLETAPVSVHDYYLDPQSERDLSSNTLRTAILERNSMFEVWVEDGGTECLGRYATLGEARAAERNQVRGILSAVDAYMTNQRDEEWKSRPACPVKWKFPMVFTDATDYGHGWPLHSKAQVLEFLANHRACIFEPDEPGSIYWWSLRDANGVSCHPVRSHRGEIRLEAVDQERVG